MDIKDLFNEEKSNAYKEKHEREGEYDEMFKF